MARYRGPRCKLMRREQVDLDLISLRRMADTKCKLNTIPGNANSSKVSDYGVQLRAKQLLRRNYGIMEKQFRKIFNLAKVKQGSTGNNLLMLLESRLDNVVYRMGFGCTRAEARQIVSHCSIKVNGKLVNIPSYLVLPGDVISVTESAKQHIRIKESISLAESVGFPSWVEVDTANLSGVFKDLPDRNDLSHDIKEQLVVEFYSK